ncbi:MAG TPA: hypothetical protein ENJ50_02175 [Planctomycetaceae bacterium]|nr:hypothetical protein [Planctomycetaceae bacterium]
MIWTAYNKPRDPLHLEVGRLSARHALRRFAKTVRDHIDGILGFFSWHGQTSGLCEGINNKVKLALHKAFGVHSSGAFASMVYLQCGGFDLPLRPPR